MSSPYARELERELEKLRAFYKEVARLTHEHGAVSIKITGEADQDYAVVWPKDLDAALKKVNPNWSKET